MNDIYGSAGLVCLPPAGYSIGPYIHYVGEDGIYWSSYSYDGTDLYGAVAVSFDFSVVNSESGYYRNTKSSVRLITDVK